MLESEKKKNVFKQMSLWHIHGLMLAASLIVSSSFPVGKAITFALEPTVLLLLRYLFASLCLFPIIKFNNGFHLPAPKQILGYSLISATTVGFFWCMFEALRYTSALNTSVIFTLVPGISGVYSLIFFKERLGRFRLIALFFGLAGSLWVIFEGEFGRFHNLDINYGDLLFLIGCFLMAGYTPLVKCFYKRESMLVMTFWVLVTGVGWLIPLSLQSILQVDWYGVESQIWIGIIYLAVFSTVITFYLTHISTIYLGPTRVMAYSYLYPVMVLLINWVVGKGLPSFDILPGVVIVSLATIVLQYDSKKGLD